jgi:hypothetical protein
MRHEGGGGQEDGKCSVLSMHCGDQCIFVSEISHLLEICVSVTAPLQPIE